MQTILEANFFRNNENVHQHLTRHAGDFHIQPTNTALGRNTLKTQGALLWNSLSLTIKSSRSPWRI